MNKSDISQYVSGKVEPNQDKLYILSNALNVREAWLMGYDICTDKMSMEVMDKSSQSAQFIEFLGSLLNYQKKAKTR